RRFFTAGFSAEEPEGVVDELCDLRQGQPSRYALLRALRRCAYSARKRIAAEHDRDGRCDSRAEAAITIAIGRNSIDAEHNDRHDSTVHAAARQPTAAGGTSIRPPGSR